MSPRAAWRLESLGFTQVYDYGPGKTDWLAAGLPREGEASSIPLAGDIVRDVATCRPYEMLSAVRARLGGDVATCVVVNDAGIVVGLLRRSQLESEEETIVERVMEPGPTTVRASELLADLVGRMQRARVRRILVTTPEGSLIGMLDREEAGDLVGEHSHPAS